MFTIRRRGLRINGTADAPCATTASRSYRRRRPPAVAVAAHDQPQSSIARVSSWMVLPSLEEPRKQPWLAGLGLSPFVVGWKSASFTSGEHALAVRVPTSLAVALGCDEHVRAHCVQVATAKRAGVG